MKKEAKVEFGIEIVKPWSKEMYAHNEMVAEAVRILVTQRWENALNTFEETLSGEFDEDVEWSVLATAEMKEIQRAVTAYGFGFGYTVEAVSDRVMQELEDMPLYQLKELVEELDIKLDTGFVGFN